ncbi:MAG: deoxyribose-phosphate aldolase [Bacteroidales bacterium]|nr:deoxyribose-phosphate aldolase [Bacteroidales bacterium]
MDHNELVDKITNQVMSKIKNNTQLKSTVTDLSDSNNRSSEITTQELARYFDHTLLKPDAVDSQFDQLCEEAKKYNFYSVCVNSSWVKYVAKKVRGSNVKVCSVIGFPLGETDSRSKAFETRNALENGANEIDMVISVGALKSGNIKYVEEDIRAVQRACRSTTVLKVILETSLLTEEEKVIACEICKKVDVDFVKTSTGFGNGGATIADIELMRRVVGPKMGVKASGGIRDFKTAVSMIKAGATRIGAGASVAIIEGDKVTGNY